MPLSKVYRFGKVNDTDGAKAMERYFIALKIKTL